MNLHGRLVALFVILALAGRARGQRARDQHRTLPIRAIAARTCVAAVMAAGWWRPLTEALAGCYLGRRRVVLAELHYRARLRPFGTFRFKS
jgi:hypothetical protein